MRKTLIKNMDSKIKILLIDDDEVDRTVVKRALKGTELDYTITECEDAELVVDLLKDQEFDCVFLDYLLPGTDGLVLLRKLRAEGIGTPIVIITSQGDEKIAVDMMKAGATDYVIKTHLNAHSITQILRNAIRLQEIEMQRIQTELALKESEARLAEAQRISKLGNWECNYNDRSFYWSVEMYRIFNKDPKNYTPTLENIFENFHPDDRKAIKDMLKRASEGEEFKLDFRFNTPGESQKYGNTQGHMVFDADRRPLKIIGTVQDITDRKRVEQELIKAKQLTEETSRTKEQFLANMSHEIRTPMNAIIGFARLLLKENLTSEQKKYIEAIYNSGENLLVVVNDILDFSKISSGKMKLEEAPFSLSEVVNNIMEMFWLKAKEKNIIFSSEIENDVPLSLVGDSVRLTQVLINLLSNAFKFTEHGYIYLNIRQLEQNDHFVELQYTIEDTGIGIPEDKLESIFDSFTQATSSTTRRFGGTGLGLTIVKNIVELQSGHIKVMSKEGKGSTFIITCKYKKNNAAEQSETLLTNSSDIENYTELLRGVKVLIVEDNHLNQLLAKAVLTKANCIVDIAENGLIAIEKLKIKQFDIVLMDIQMPEMDGYEATKHIRTLSEKPLADIPIIAMTAHALHTEVEKCLGIGMNDYISKPFKTKDLYGKIYNSTLNNSKVDKSDNISLRSDSGNEAATKQNRPAEEIGKSEEILSSGSIVDFESIREYTEGDDNFMREIVNVFLLEMPGNILGLVELQKNKDWENLGLLAHKCKSSYSMMRILALQDLMGNIESLIKKNPLDEQEIAGLINQTITLNAQVMIEMQAEVDKMPK